MSTHTDRLQALTFAGRSLAVAPLPGVKDAASKTASAVAAIRADHARHARGQRVHLDPLALQLTSPGWRAIVSRRPLAALARRFYDFQMPGVRGQVLARQKFAEERLAQARRLGLGQYVILGAGLDSFAYRDAEDLRELAIFEVDTLPSQVAKRQALARAKIPLPRNVAFVAQDLERRGLGAGLDAAGFERDRPALFAMLGTTMYVPKPALLATLRNLAGYTSGGSELVFDYYVAGFERLAEAQRLTRFVARRGEPMVTGFSPQRIGEELRAVGFELVEHLSPAEINASLLTGAAEKVLPPSFMYLARCRVC